MKEHICLHHAIFPLFRVCVHSPLLRRDRLWAAVLRGVLLPPVPLVGHECFVDGKVLDVGLEDVHDIRLTGNHHQLGEKKHVKNIHSI